MMSLQEYRTKSASLADFLPWVALVGPGVVLNKDGSFQRTARFRGPDLDSATPAELVAVTSRLNNALRRLGSGWAVFVEAQRTAAQAYPQSRFPDPVSALVDRERREQFREEGAHFESGYYLTLLWMPPPEEAARAEGWLYEGKASTGVDPKELVKSFADRTDRVLHLVEGFMPEAAWLDDAATLIRCPLSASSIRLALPPGLPPNSTRTASCSALPILALAALNSAAFRCGNCNRCACRSASVSSGISSSTPRCPYRPTSRQPVRRVRSWELKSC